MAHRHRRAACSSTARRPCRTCRSTCRRSTAISSSSRATRCSARPASASSMASREVLEAHAAVAGRRQYDRRRHLREDDLSGAARPLRGRHRQHRRRRRPWRRASTISIRIGMANIAAYEHELLLYATEGLNSVPGLRIIGTADEKAGVLSLRARRLPQRRRRRGARPRRHRGALRPSLRPADPAALRPRDDGAAVARLLQHARRYRRARQRPAAHLDDGALPHPIGTKLAARASA